MKKEELEKKLERIKEELESLKAILDEDPQEYAEKLTSQYGKKWESNETYPYKVGVAQTIIKYILKDNF